MSKNDQFTFEISLSILNHLGRNLYRSFMTVIGEALSNSWDADANNVWIYIDRDNSSLIIKDDGDGMSEDDFQGKFLKIGYSKRKDGITRTEKDRPFIGRKGIGKLALLSCAEKITIISKTLESGYTGGVINNSELDTAIEDALAANQYMLGEPDLFLFQNYIKEHKKGTIIHFENINNGIRNRVDYLKKQIALYFRFSLLDDAFNIHVDGEKITCDHLDDLAIKTQFLWIINKFKDPYTEKLLSEEYQGKKRLTESLLSEGSFKGFFASVIKPSNLKVSGTDEKLTVDLFVNGRLRERDILKYIPTARIAQSYLYGQIHFDELDGEIDRFTSSREGIVADDPKFKEMLGYLKEILAKIIEKWDVWRREINQDGDPDNTKHITKRERRSEELYNVVAKDFSLPKHSKNKSEVAEWVNEFADDARFNFSSYAECFIAENVSSQ